MRSVCVDTLVREVGGTTQIRSLSTKGSELRVQGLGRGCKCKFKPLQSSLLSQRTFPGMCHPVVQAFVGSNPPPHQTGGLESRMQKVLGYAFWDYSS